MTKQLSAKTLLLLLLLVVLAGIGWHFGFYRPIQSELASVSAQSQALDLQLIQQAEKVSEMDAMEEELNALLARPAEEIAPIAPYDNKAQVLTLLNTILERSGEYSLQFAQPVLGKDGSVRRIVTMSVRCADFATAKAIVRDLSSSPCRCLVNNLSLSGSGNILDGFVQLNATITFLESTKLTP